jgi:transposase
LKSKDVKSKGTKWSKKDKQKLFHLYLQHGNCWTEISKKFKGRSPASVKKVFHRMDPKEYQESANSLSGKNEKIEKDPVTEKKEKIVEKANNDKIKQTIETIARADLIIEKIVKSVAKAPEYKPFKISKSKSKHSPQESFLLLSDCHIGLSVIPEEVGGIGHYNVDIFKSRLENLVKTVCRITDLHRSTHQLDTLHIPILGDMVHGSNDAGQWGFLHTEQDIVDQVFIALSSVGDALITLSQYYKNVKVYGVVGNHGRVGKRGVEKNHVNWDYIVYKWLQAKLENQKNIDFTVPKSPFYVLETLDQKFLLTHGSNIRGWNGIPWYGLGKAEAKYRGLMDRSKNVEKMFEEAKNRGINISDPKAMATFAFNYNDSFKYMLCGHFHQMGEVETASGGRIILNASFIGGDDYSINDLTCASTPAQKFFGANRHRKTWSYDIELDRDNS